MARNIFKMEDINRVFTDKVAEYIAKGMAIHTETMGGTQGELCKVDFTDGDGVIRVLMDRGYSEEFENMFYDTVYISVRRYAKAERPLWNNKGDELERIVFYSIRRDKFMADFTQFANAMMKRRNRRAARWYSSSEQINISADKVVKLVRAHRGYGRVKASDIKSVCRVLGETKYFISFKNDKPTITVRYEA